VVLAALLCAASASAQTSNGRLAGVVVDADGKPQMGATIWVGADGLLGANTIRVRTNQAGRFVLDYLPTGAYDVRVTLAGFMPVLNRNVVISANATTVLKLELGSVLSAVTKMRQASKAGTEPDDWDWVLRSSTNTRPVLRWKDEDDANGSTTADAGDQRHAPRGRVELTSGDTEPGIASSLTESAFAYDQPIGIYGKLLMAGQFSYDAPGTAALSTTWVPFGESANSPRTTFALRQYHIDGQQGPMLRTLRSEQAGTLRVTDRVTVRYAAEYVWLSLRNTTSAIDPRAEITMQLAQGWTATMVAGTIPAREPAAASLESAVGQLGIFPSVMFTNSGNAIIGRSWHEEVRIEHRVVKGGEVSVAGFRDQSSHTPVYATFVAGGIDPIDALPVAHALDGGAISSYGARFAYKQRITESLEAAVVYSWAGALSADVPLDGPTLRSILQERSRNSLAFSMGGRIQKTKTRLNCNYKWVDGLEASRQDPYSEALYNMDPFLNMSIHQPLPVTFGGGKVEAVAELLNVLGEGTTYRNTAEGRMSITPAPRILRGGLSFQF
jgi:Carboxypeptidase regulatory-like domain